MFKSVYLKAAFRSLLGNKFLSVINICGLAVGIALCSLVLIFAGGECKYDSFYPRSGFMYRVASRGIVGDDVVNSALSPMPLASLLDSLQEDVVFSVRFVQGRNKLVEGAGVKFNEDRFFYADEDFFKVFKQDFIIGDPHVCLSGIGDIVITESVAKKYFGTVKGVLGRTLSVDNGLVFNVSGVCRDVPANSHFHFDFIAPLKSVELLFMGEPLKLKSWNESWLTIDCYTYLMFGKGVDKERFECKVNEETRECVGRQLSEAFADTFLVKNNVNLEFYLQNINDIHLYSHLDNEIEPNLSIKDVKMFAWMGIFLLLVICLNFVNLNTSRPDLRFGELAARKISGAVNRHLKWQFFWEAVVVSFIALFLAFVLIELLLPFFNKWFSLELSVKMGFGQSDVWWVLLFAFVIGVLAGVSPSFYFSRLSFVNLLKKRLGFDRKESFFRALVAGGQVVVAMVLVLVALAVDRQVDSVLKKSPGYSSENILVVERGYAVADRFVEFKHEMIQLNGVESISGCEHVFGDEIFPVSFRYNKNEDDGLHLFAGCFGDQDIFSTLGLELVQDMVPNDFSEGFLGVVLNQAAARELGLEVLSGDSITFLSGNVDEDWQLPVVGVVKDFYFEDLKHEIAPLVLIFPREEPAHFSYLFIDLGDNYEVCRLEIEDVWNRYSDQAPFETFFLNDRIKEVYHQEILNGRLLLFLAVVSVLMGLVGVLAWSSWSFRVNQYDLLVRRGMGASVFQLGVYLWWRIGRSVFFSVILAFPLAGLAFRYWSASFVFVDWLPPLMVASIGMGGLLLLCLFFVVQFIVGIKMISVRKMF